jgi:hypothetical protein
VSTHRRTIVVSAAERERYDRLLTATDHVAPFITFSSVRFDDNRYLDTVRVVREYAKGNALLAVASEAVRRLAAGKYGRRRGLS